MNKKRARECIYVTPQQALKYFLSAQVILRLPLFPLLSRWNKLVQTQKEYATLEDCAVLVVICKMALQTKSFQLVLED